MLVAVFSDLLVPCDARYGSILVWKRSPNAATLLLRIFEACSRSSRRTSSVYSNRKPSARPTLLRRLPTSPWGLSIWGLPFGKSWGLSIISPTNFLEESGYTNGKSQRRIPQACCARVFDPQQGSGIICDELWRPSSWAGRQICCLRLPGIKVKAELVERQLHCAVPHLMSHSWHINNCLGYPRHAAHIYPIPILAPWSLPSLGLGLPGRC